jgi:hypothetical protein
MLLKHDFGYHIQSGLTLTPLLSHINIDYELKISSININFNIITESLQGLHSGHFLWDFLLQFCALYSSMSATTAPDSPYLFSTH